MVRLKTAASFGLALWLSGHIGSVIAGKSHGIFLSVAYA
jgi:type IV secretory pathway TrbD component